MPDTALDLTTKGQNHYHKKKDYVRVIGRCSNLLFVAVKNAMANSNLGRKGFISSHRLESLIEGGQAGATAAHDLQQNSRRNAAHWLTPHG